MNYLILIPAAAFLFISFFYHNKFKKFQNSGKIPVLIAARRNTNIFLVLALSVAILFICVTFIGKN